MYQHYKVIHIFFSNNFKSHYNCKTMTYNFFLDMFPKKLDVSSATVENTINSAVALENV